MVTIVCNLMSSVLRFVFLLRLYCSEVGFL